MQFLESHSWSEVTLIVTFKTIAMFGTKSYSWTKRSDNVCHSSMTVIQPIRTETLDCE